MTITAGTRIGVLEFVAPLGEGGMGQVWRAVDTALGRQVAVKLLPEAFAADLDRRARFEREARTLAALNHPNIASVYGFEASTARLALVMELVGGEDLSARIALAAIPIDQTLRLARQILEALEAAHGQGIVHRDLKPSNIRIRSDDTVKVLDFGLAKAIDVAAPTSARDYSPTLTAPPLTEPGATPGTAAYMSPEQARGMPLDARADLWSFGVVLWEMLTRRRPFEGATASDIVAAVLTRQPEWDLLPAQTPPSIRRLLRRCLDKDRRRRLDSAAAARLEIEDALSGTLDERAAEESHGVAVRWPRRTPAALVAATAVVVAVASWMSWRTPTASPPVPETRVDLVTPPSDDPMSFALSPDGRQIVFAASDGGVSRLWLRSMAASKAEPLVGTDGARYPFWSPDSRSIGFFSAAQLKRLDLAGGAPITLARVSSAPSGGTWNAAGVIVFAPGNEGPLFQVPADGGSAVAVTSLDGHTSHRFPTFLPDGRRFLFYATGPTDAAGIHLGTLDSTAGDRLTAADSAGAYVSMSVAQDVVGVGWLVWTRAGALVGQRLDPVTSTLVGDLVPVAEHAGFNVRTRAVALSVGAGGVIAFRSTAASPRQLVWHDRSGQRVGTLGAPDEELRSPDLSPRGVAAVYRIVDGNTDIWLTQDDRFSRFTFDAGDERYPIWSPDGDRLVFDSRGDGHHRLYVKTVSGAEPEELLVDWPAGVNASDWSADGKYVLFHRADPATAFDLWVLPMGAPRVPWPLIKTASNERQGTFSPDGRWVAYLSDASGRPEIYIRAFATPAAAGAGRTTAPGQWQVSTEGGSYPRWSRDGKELYYIGPTGAMIAAPVTMSASSVQAGKPVALFQTRISGGGVDAQAGRQYDVAADGRFLINTVVDVTTPITLIQNWRPEHRQ